MPLQEATATGGADASNSSRSSAGRIDPRMDVGEPHEEEEDGWEVRCVCGVTQDDAKTMLSCDKCKVWQHAGCVVVNGMVPEHYFCEECRSERRSPPNPDQLLL